MVVQYWTTPVIRSAKGVPMIGHWAINGLIYLGYLGSCFNTFQVEHSTEFSISFQYFFSTKPYKPIITKLLYNDCFSINVLHFFNFLHFTSVTLHLLMNFYIHINDDMYAKFPPEESK